mgnify:CR=1 FL=1
MLGFDSYTEMSSHLRAVLDGVALPSHTPGDRRTLLPISPVDRAAAVEPGAIEIGIPFSDPVMDGPVIQDAAVRAACKIRSDDRSSV